MLVTILAHRLVLSSIVPDLDSTSNRDEDHVDEQLKSETRDGDGEQSHIKQFELLLLLEHESVKGFTVSAIDKCRGNPFIFAAAYAYRFGNKETRSIKQSEASHFDSDLKVNEKLDQVNIQLTSSNPAFTLH